MLAQTAFEVTEHINRWDGEPFTGEGIATEFKKSEEFDLEGDRVKRLEPMRVEGSRRVGPFHTASCPSSAYAGIISRREYSPLR